MIAIRLPASTVEEAVAVRDRVEGLIVQDFETVMIVDGGVEIRTEDPVRVINELAADGFV